MRRHRDSRSRIQHANARSVGHQAVVVNGLEPQVPGPVPPPPITADGFESGHEDVAPSNPCGEGSTPCATNLDGSTYCCPDEEAPPATPELRAHTPAGAQVIATETRVVTAPAVPRAIPFAARGPALRANGDPVVIDVRTPEEFRTGHLPTALSIPVDDLETRMQEIADATEGDWNAPIQVYCRKGIRSKKAADYLTGVGFTNVTDLGGLEGSLGGVRRPQVLTEGVW